MEISERAKNALSDLGLTSYETKAYLALIERPSMSASEISKMAEVPYSKIYEVLAGLEKKGWVETEDGKPAKYYPRSPSVAVEAMRMKYERERRQNESHILTELMPLFERKETRERPDIWIIRGEFNLLSKIRETILRCEQELLVAAPVIPPELAEFSRTTFTTFSEKGVQIMLMTSTRADGLFLDDISKVAQVRVRETMYGGGIISDAREVILLIGREDEEGSDLAISSDHVGLARLAKNYFEYLWNDSKVLANRKSAIAGKKKADSSAHS